MVKYAYTIEKQDGTTEKGFIVSVNTATAHNAMQKKVDGEKYRLYPMSRVLLSLGIATATAKNAVMREGTDTQYRIDAELRILSAMTSFTLAARPSMRDNDISTYIMGHVAKLSHDTQDFLSTAIMGVCDVVQRGGDVFHATDNGYKVLNKSVHAQRAATEFEKHNEFIIANGGDIVTIGRAVHRIIYGGDKWYDMDGGDMDDDTAIALGAAISAALDMCTATQRDIARLLAIGYSQRQIAEKTGRTERTVKSNIAIMRGTVSDYIKTYAPQFARLIDVAAVQAAKQAAKNRRTAAGAAKHDMEAAARMRAYRARKKAAAQAAAERAQAAAMYHDFTQRPIAQAAAILRDSIK